MADKKNVAEGVGFLQETLGGYLDEEISGNLREIAQTVEAAKAADFALVFDPTLVRGMSYYTGTIFEIAIPEFGGSCGGGGRYDEMIGKFTGQNVPACGFSIGFERIILLLMEQGFEIPERPKKVAYLVEKKYPAEKLTEVFKAGKRSQRKRTTGTGRSYEQEQKVPKRTITKRRLRRIRRIFQ